MGSSRGDTNTLARVQVPCDPGRADSTVGGFRSCLRQAAGGDDSDVAAVLGLSEFNGREVLSELGNEVGGVEEAPVFAAPAHRDQAVLERTSSPCVLPMPASRA